MPRTYKRKLGAQKYKDYSTENVEAALTKIVDEGWSLRRAAAHYKIPFGTLNNKHHGRYTKMAAKKYFRIMRKGLS